MLAGLCRTCEIFGVGELVLSNLKLLEEKQFQSLSVTAEKWIKLTEVCSVCHSLCSYPFVCLQYVSCKRTFPNIVHWFVTEENILRVLVYLCEILLLTTLFWVCIFSDMTLLQPWLLLNMVTRCNWLDSIKLSNPSLGETCCPEGLSFLNAWTGLQHRWGGTNSTEQVHHQVPVSAENSTCAGVRTCVPTKSTWWHHCYCTVIIIMSSCTLVTTYGHSLCSQTVWH